MRHEKEIGSPLAAIAAGATERGHLPLHYPKGGDEVSRRVGHSLHLLTKRDCKEKGIALPAALLDPRDTDCRPGVETLVYAYKFATLEGGVLAIPRPRIKTNTRGLVSSSDSPAVLWADGSKIYAYNGVWIHPDIYEKPENITLEMVSSARSAEIRRCMMEHYPGGALELIGKWAKGGKITVIDKDNDAMGVRILFSFSDLERYVLVTTVDISKNSKYYLLRVSPAIINCKDAVASTFPLPGNFKYAPQVES